MSPRACGSPQPGASGHGGDGRTSRGWRALAPGLALCLGAALVALGGGAAGTALLGRPLVEPIVLALLLGVAARNLLPRPTVFVAGTALAAGLVLEVAIALLGASVDLRVLAAAGWRLGVVIVVGVTATIAAGHLAGRAAGLSRRSSTLVGVGNGVCGNSAIAAVGPVIGATRTELAGSLGVTAVLGVLLVLVLPLLAPLLGLDDLQYGVLAGMSSYAVPQVVAAALPVSETSLQVATVVKLARVVLLGPVVVVLALLYRSRRRGTEVAGDPAVRRGIGAYLPWFVVVFLVLAVLRSAGLLPAGLPGPLASVSSALTLLAMAGLGFGVDLRALRSTGPRLAVAVVVSLLLLVGLTLGLIRLLGIAAA